MRYNKENWPWGVEPFYPNHMLNQGLATLLILVPFLAVVCFAPGLFMLPEIPADPLRTPEHVKPEWYFLPVYQWLKYFPAELFGRWGALVGILTQAPLVLVLFCLPFLDRRPERDVRRRPLFLVLSLGLALFVLAVGFCGADPLGATAIVRPASPAWLPAHALLRLFYPDGAPLEGEGFLGVRYAILGGVLVEVLLAGAALILPVVYGLRRPEAQPRPGLLYGSLVCVLALLGLGVWGYCL